jgi:hypothetical protein
LKDTLTEKSKLEGDRDTQKDRADKAEKELKELKEAGPDQTRIDQKGLSLC